MERRWGAASPERCAPERGSSLRPPGQRGAAPPRSRTAGPAVGRRPATSAPALCQQVLEALLARGPSGVYADCTFGGGGHARALLRELAADGVLLALDVDPLAIADAQSLAAADARIRVHHMAHSELKAAVPDGTQLSGSLFDLGVNEASERDPRRGFSLHDEFPCDLRMNPNLGVSATEWLSTVSSDELAWIIREYGDDEDPLVAARIAEGLVQRGRRQPFRTCREIADHIGRAKNHVDSKARHPAKGTFQAIRTFLNREPQQLRAGLLATFECLEMGGRCVVICNNRWEQVAAKRFMRDFEDYDLKRAQGWSLERLTQLYPLLTTDRPWSVTEVCSPIAPTPQEAEMNRKARSARALVFEKVPRHSSPSPAVWHPKSHEELARLLFQRPERLPTFAGELEEDKCNSRREESAGPANDATIPAERPAAGNIQDWLLSVDGGEGRLLGYQDVVQKRYGSLPTIYRLCVQDGQVSPHFFEDAGVGKLGHRRLFQRWFADHPVASEHPQQNGANEASCTQCGEHPQGSLQSDKAESPKMIDRELEYFRSLQRDNAVSDREHGVPPPLHTEASLAAGEAELFSGMQASGFNVKDCRDLPVERSGTNADRVAPVDSFEDIAEQFQIPPWLCLNVSRCGFRHPTQVQRHAVPFALIGRDVLVSSPTGSGKTIAYLIPLIVALPEDSACSRATTTYEGAAKPFGLIVAPTRELSMQIHLQARKLCHGSPFRLAQVTGGQSLRQQFPEIARGIDLCVTTPGRFSDYVEREIISLGNIRFLVLDEADAMLEQGFEPQIRRLVAKSGMPSCQTRQTMMFSAIFIPAIQSLAGSLLYDYIWVEVGRTGMTAESIDQVLKWVTPDQKPTALLDIMSESAGKTLVFVRRKKDTADLIDVLRFAGHYAASIHGDLPQQERDDVLRRFCNGRLQTLVATDIAGRGLDIPEVQCVVNYDLPLTLDEYVHRIGRTGRAGRRGLAVSLFVSRGVGENLSIAHGLFKLLRKQGVPIPDGLEADVGLRFSEKERERRARQLAHQA